MDKIRSKAENILKHARNVYKKTSPDTPLSPRVHLFQRLRDCYLIYTWTASNELPGILYHENATAERLYGKGEEKETANKHSRVGYLALPHQVHRSQAYL